MLIFPVSHFSVQVQTAGVSVVVSPVVHECHKVGFVHLIKEMDGVFALVVPVNEDIEVVAAFGRYRDKLLVAAEIVHKGCVPVGGKGAVSSGVPRR